MGDVRPGPARPPPRLRLRAAVIAPPACGEFTLRLPRRLVQDSTVNAPAAVFRINTLRTRLRGLRTGRDAAQCQLGVLAIVAILEIEQLLLQVSAVLEAGVAEKRPPQGAADSIASSLR